MVKVRTRRALPLLVFFTFVMGVRAEAQPADTDEQAKTLFQRGTTLYAEGDYDGAASALEESYRLSARADLLFNLANVYERNGQAGLAAARLRRYLPDADPEDEQALRKRIARLDERVARKQQDLRARTLEQNELKRLREQPGGDNSNSAQVTRSHSLELGLAAGSIVFLGLGTGFAFAARSADDRVQASCAQGQQESFCLEAADSALTSRRRFSLAADLSIGLGLGAAIAAGYIYWRKSQKDTKPAVVPTVGATGIGVHIVGGF